MTREEAIEVLNGIEEVHGTLPEDGNKIDEALSMAIKALEQEPCEDANANQHNSNALNDVGQHTNALEVDAISRQAVLDYIHRILNQGTGKKKSFEFIQKYVEKQPPVKPQPCEDAISRSAAIKAIDERAKRIKNEDTLNGLAGAVGVLFDLPPVKPQESSEDVVSRGVFEQVMWERDVAIEQLKDLGYGLGEKPKTGHWIYKPKTDLSICDKCGSYCPQDKYGRIETNFCPSCGARMFEPQERSENVT